LLEIQKERMTKEGLTDHKNQVNARANNKCKKEKFPTSNPWLRGNERVKVKKCFTTNNELARNKEKRASARCSTGHFFRIEGMTAREESECKRGMWKWLGTQNALLRLWLSSKQNN
jgi:hypothetical protein